MTRASTKLYKRKKYYKKGPNITILQKKCFYKNITGELLSVADGIINDAAKTIANARKVTKVTLGSASCVKITKITSIRISPGLFITVGYSCRNQEIFYNDTVALSPVFIYH